MSSNGGLSVRGSNAAQMNNNYIIDLDVKKVGTASRTPRGP